MSHKFLMVRNPWGEDDYNGAWHNTDPQWTDELAAQVPHNIDPRTSDAYGIFTVPIETAIKHTDEDPSCFYSFEIAHRRLDYTRTWFDVIDAPVLDHMTGVDELW